MQLIIDTAKTSSGNFANSVYNLNMFVIGVFLSTVFFSPGPDCETAIINNINNSTKTIDAAVYSITNPNIVAALKNAHDRGIKIRILTDRTQAGNKKSLVWDMFEYGINVVIHRKYRIEHNKFAIYDGNRLSTGSYNWTTNASAHNSENCIFLDTNDPAIDAYQRRFDYLWEINNN